MFVISTSRAFQPRLEAWVETVGDTTKGALVSDAVPNRGRRVLSIAENPEAVSGDETSLAAAF